MIKRQSHSHHNTKQPISSLHSAASFTWIPLTLILLLYTSGLCTGDTTAKPDDVDKIPEVETVVSNATVKLTYNKTGNPQIDYVHDPNLPRELNGFNLSDYPFFSRVPPPEAINYSCDGLKDGYYASIEYKCQVYHHCLFGTRYDFLCANYTAFDQKTFICQFVSEVDCPNSALFYNKNDDLYWTTTEAPDRPRQSSGKRLRPAVQTYFPRKYTPNVTPAPDDDAAKAVNNNNQDESEEEYVVDPPPRRRKQQQGPRNRRRCKRGRCRGRNRPRARPRPAYYDYDDDYEEDDYYDYENEYYDERPNKRRREKPKVAGGRKVAGSKKVETSTEKVITTEATTRSTTTVSTTEAPVDYQDVSETAPLEPVDVDNAGKTREEIFTKSRPPPRIRPPVPRHERNKYGAMQGRAPGTAPSTTSTTPAPPAPSAKSVNDDEYYDDDYQLPTSKAKSTTTAKPRPTTPAAPTTLSSRQRFVNRNLRPATTSLTTTSTTPRTTSTTTKTTTTATTPRPIPQRSTATTSTTTEAPQYDYEYEYEDELPASSSTEKSSPAPTTTTTTTTTLKPSRSNYRGNKRPSAVASSSVQTSTSVTVNEQDQDEAQGQTDEADASQNVINRRRSSWTRNQSTKSGVVAETTPNSIVSTSERFSVKSIQRSPPQTYQEPVITVKSAPPAPKPQQEKVPELPVSRTRPSRFWQRPSKVVPTTIDLPLSTTEIPADYGDYQDDPEPASVPVPRYSSPKSGSSSAPSVAYQRPQVSANSEDVYSQQPQYSRTGHQYASSNNNNNNNQQFLRQSVGPYRPPPQSPARVTIDPSNYVSPYAPEMTSSVRPEFISLLRDDEGPYYDDAPVVPQQSSRFKPSPQQNSFSSSSSSSSRRMPPQRPQYFGNQPYHQTQKNLYGAAQESYPTFVNPPRGFSSNGFMNDFRYPMMFLRGP